MQKNIFLILDTETADLSGAVYDVGYTIATKKGDILAERNFLVEEIFTNADPNPSPAHRVHRQVSESLCFF